MPNSGDKAMAAQQPLISRIASVGRLSIHWNTEVPGYFPALAQDLQCELVSGTFTSTDAMFEELPLHRVAGNGEGSSEMISCGFVPPTAQFKLAERGMEEGVMDQAVRIRDRMNFLKSTLRTVPLGDSDGTIECHHG